MTVWLSFCCTAKLYRISWIDSVSIENDNVHLYYYLHYNYNYNITIYKNELAKSWPPLLAFPTYTEYIVQHFSKVKKTPSQRIEFLTLVRMALLGPWSRMAKNFECPCSAFSQADRKIINEDINCTYKRLLTIQIRPVQQTIMTA